jgi:hypothetical protein
LDYNEDFAEVLVPIGENLNKEGVITVSVEENAKYGFKITNSSAVDLFASLFYFDASDLSISALNFYIYRLPADFLI